jgi:hypothetical protein
LRDNSLCAFSVAGAGNREVDGQYYICSASNGKANYRKADGETQFLAHQDGWWQLVCNGEVSYRCRGSAPVPPNGAQWTARHGPEPAPSVYDQTKLAISDQQSIRGPMSVVLECSEVESSNDIGAGFKNVHLQAAIHRALPHHNLLVSDERFATLFELGATRWRGCIPGGQDPYHTAEEALNASKRQWSLQLGDGVLQCQSMQQDERTTKASIRRRLQKALAELAGKGWTLSLETESNVAAPQGEVCKGPPLSDVSTAVGTRLSVDTACS